MNRIGGRFVVNRTNTPNKIPTISTYPEHLSGMWTDSDIYEGELYINTFDNRFWFRNTKNEIIELPVLNTETLKIDDKYLPDMFGKVNYKGLYNDGIINSNLGDYYIINKKSIINNVIFNIGDYIVFNGYSWDKIDNSSKEIIISDIIIDVETDKNLKDILNDLYSKIPLNSIKLLDNNNEYFSVDYNNILYKNNHLYHSGNSNSDNINWTAKILFSEKIETKNIYAEFIISKKIKSDEFISNEVISKKIISENISTNNLELKNGRISFTDNLIYIDGNGNGFSFNHGLEKVFKYNSNNNNTLFYNKLLYKNDFIFIDDLDIVNKKYVDEQINKTINIDVDDFTDKIYLLRLNIKYINIDIIKKNDFFILVDEIERSDSSFLVTLCVESCIEYFNIFIKSNENILYEINKIGIITLYFNSKNKKWYFKN